MVSSTSAEALGSQLRRTLFEYIRSFIEMLGDTLKYLNMVNVADTGTLWRIPLLQSLMRLFLKNSFCFDVRLFWNVPV